jgi:hypothetical protein
MILQLTSKELNEIQETINAIDIVLKEYKDKNPYDRREVRFPSEGEQKITSSKNNLVRIIQVHNQ